MLRLGRNYHFSSCSGRRAWWRELQARGAAKPSSQAGKARMIPPPIPGKAEIAIAERAGKRDLADSGGISKAGGAASSTANARATLPACRSSHFGSWFWTGR